MPATTPSDLKFEIGHVLFMDIVGYSKLVIDKQTELTRKLNEIVRGSSQFQTAEAEGTLVRLPTGDGIALVFRNHPEAPAQCALEISTALQAHPEIKIRMGIHSGPVNETADVNDRANIAGAGINIAQRVMDCGDAGHILLSKRVADDLENYARWQPRLHDLGEAEVKHGVRVQLVNLFGDGFGNPELPAKLKHSKQARVASAGRKRKWQFISATILFALLSGIALWLHFHPASQSPPVANVLPEKSIAVLPFENMSAEKDDAFFADGIQDDVLASLGKIKDLKVIARSSVMIYRGAAVAGKLREIGQTLRVSHLLQGSVRRSASRVVINVALVDTRNDNQIWSQHYDRTLSDALSLQGELAVEIARELQATLTPNEKTTVATKPTQNAEAYLLYLRARERESGAGSKEDLIAAEQLYAQAIALDPKFALAHARQSILNNGLCNSSNGPDAARKSKARALAEQALRLSPTLGEAHLALADYFYTCEGNPESALKELAVAETTAPNNGEIFWIRGACYRQQGRWRESIASYQRGQDLDPRNLDIARLNARNYKLVRDWPAAVNALNRALEIEPNSGYLLLFLTDVEWYGGNADAFRKTFARFPPDFFPLPYLIFDQAMIDRDFPTAEKTVNELKDGDEKTYLQGYLALARGDVASARRFFERLRPSFEAKVRDHPGDSPEDADLRAELGLLYAFLGRKEDAIRECRRAVDIVPASKAPVESPLMASRLALVYARTGEIDQAITLIERLLTTPGAVITGASLSQYSITLMDLRLRWEWDPLRNDPRFKKIIAGPEPKTVY
jgi:TolB-like protein